jgi:Coenzyme PQQ synthesis protein D (PqqD)
MTNDSILTLDATPQRAPGLEIRSAGSEQLVQCSATGHVHVLNALAGLVLQRCDGATPLERIVDDIVAVADVDRARAERDVLSVCADFRAKALIV